MFAAASVCCRLRKSLDGVWLIIERDVELSRHLYKRK